MNTPLWLAALSGIIILDTALVLVYLRKYTEGLLEGIIAALIIVVAMMLNSNGNQLLKSQLNENLIAKIIVLAVIVIVIIVVIIHFVNIISKDEDNKRSHRKSIHTTPTPSQDKRAK